MSSCLNSLKTITVAGEDPVKTAGTRHLTTVIAEVKFAKANFTSARSMVVCLSRLRRDRTNH